MRTSLLMAAVLLMASAAKAAPIAAGSEVSVKGSDTLTGTVLTFTSNGDVGGTSGSFSELALCTGCVSFPIHSLTSGSTGELWAISDNGLSSSLTIDSSTATSGTAQLPTFTASGTGELTLSGFDQTPGVWTLTGQGPSGGVQVTWSATAVAQGGQPIPEPGSLIILGAALGAALIGVGFVRARKGPLRAGA